MSGDRTVSFWCLIYSVGTNHNRTFYLQVIIKQITDILDFLINKNIPIAKEKPFQKVHLCSHILLQKILPVETLTRGL